MKYDVIIIGSGLGGLVCGQILSKAGMKVLILEKEVHTGGCLQSYRRNGFSFDTGFHYVGGLGEGQSLHTLFRTLGLLELPWKQLDPAFDRIRIEDRNFVFQQGYDAFTETLRNDFPEEGAALERYATLLRQTEESQLDLLNPDKQPDTLLSPLLQTGAWQYLTENFRNPWLKNVLGATSLKMELRKESLPLFTFLHGNGSFIESSWRLKGNGGLIASALERNIREKGGEIICRAEVEELVEKDGKLVCARCTDGQTYEGERFVSDVHPAVTCEWIRQSERMRRIYRQRIRALENTFGMLTVSLVVKPHSVRYFNWNQYLYRHRNIWSFPSDEQAIDRLLVSARLPEDDGIYTRQIDLLTPVSLESWKKWEQTRHGHRNAGYEEEKLRRAEECMELACRFIPDLGEQTEQIYISTPLTYRDYTGTPDGSAYGLRKDYNNPMTTFLSPRTPIPNLWLTGQNLMLHGIQGVTMTALFTCAEIVGKNYIWNLFKQQ